MKHAVTGRHLRCAKGLSNLEQHGDTDNTEQNVSRTRSVSAILSVYVSILAFPSKVLSYIVPTRFRGLSLRGFIPVNFQCVRELQYSQTNVESSTLNLWKFLDHNSWQQKSRSFFVSEELLRQFFSVITVCDLTIMCQESSNKIFQVRRFPSITQRLFGATFAPHNSRDGGKFVR